MLVWYMGCNTAWYVVEQRAPHEAEAGNGSLPSSHPPTPHCHPVMASSRCGYTGGVVYSRSPTLPPSAVPPIRAAASRAGLSYDSFCQTDNACALRRPPRQSTMASSAIPAATAQ